MLGEGYFRKTRNGLAPSSVIADRLGRTTRAPRFDGVRITAPDHSAAWGIAVQIADGEYEYPGLLPERGDVVIDIGANVGLFSLWASRRGASTTAYEPAPETFEHLSRNVSGKTIVPVHGAVVGDRSRGETVDLFLHAEESVRNTILGREIQTGESMTTATSVPAFAIGDVLATPCDLLKIDCEGAEFEIVEGATDEELRRARRFILEFHRSAGDPDALVARFVRAGFDCRILEGADAAEPFGVIGGTRR